MPSETACVTWDGRHFMVWAPWSAVKLCLHCGLWQALSETEIVACPWRGLSDGGDS